MTIKHDQRMIKLMNESRRTKEVRIIHKLINSDNSAPKRKELLRYLLNNSSVSREGLVNLVCDMREALINPVEPRAFYKIISISTDILVSERGTAAATASSAKDPKVQCRKKVHGLWLQYRNAIKSQTYRSQYLAENKTGGLEVFAEDMERKFKKQITRGTIKNRAPKWEKEYQADVLKKQQPETNSI